MDSVKLLFVCFQLVAVNVVGIRKATFTVTPKQALVGQDVEFHCAIPLAGSVRSFYATIDVTENSRCRYSVMDHFLRSSLARSGPGGQVTSLKSHRGIAKRGAMTSMLTNEAVYIMRLTHVVCVNARQYTCIYSIDGSVPRNLSALLIVYDRIPTINVTGDGLCTYNSDHCIKCGYDPSQADDDLVFLVAAGTQISLTCHYAINHRRQGADPIYSVLRWYIKEHDNQDFTEYLQENVTKTEASKNDDVCGCEPVIVHSSVFTYTAMPRFGSVFKVKCAVDVRSRTFQYASQRTVTVCTKASPFLKQLLLGIFGACLIATIATVGRFLYVRSRLHKKRLSRVPSESRSNCQIEDIEDETTFTAKEWHDKICPVSEGHHLRADDPIPEPNALMIQSIASKRSIHPVSSVLSKQIDIQERLKPSRVVSHAENSTSLKGIQKWASIMKSVGVGSADVDEPMKSRWDSMVAHSRHSLRLSTSKPIASNISTLKLTTDKLTPDKLTTGGLLSQEATNTLQGRIKIFRIHQEPRQSESSNGIVAVSNQNTRRTATLSKNEQVRIMQALMTNEEKSRLIEEILKDTLDAFPTTLEFGSIDLSTRHEPMVSPGFGLNDEHHHFPSILESYPPSMAESKTSHEDAITNN